MANSKNGWDERAVNDGDFPASQEVIKGHSPRRLATAKSIKQSYLSKLKKAKTSHPCTKGLFAQWAEEFRRKHNLDRNGDPLPPNQ